MSETYHIMDDEKFKEYVINRLTPFVTILSYAGYSGYSTDGKVFCPFHSNTESPAAKIYVNKSEGDSLWCFSEQKRYRPADVIKHKMIKTSVHSVFISIWKQLSEDDQKQLIEDYGKPVSYLPEGWEENKKLLEPFKSGKINFTQYLTILKHII